MSMFGEWEASDALAFVERTESHLDQLVDAINAGDGDRAIEHIAEAIRWNRRTGRAIGGAATAPVGVAATLPEAPRPRGQYLKYVGGPCGGWSSVVPEWVKRVWSARTYGRSRRPMLLESGSIDLPVVPPGTEMVGYYEVDAAKEVAQWNPVEQNPESRWGASPLLN